MNLGEINFDELEFEEIGLWPLAMRVVVLIGLCCLVVGGIYFFLIKDNYHKYISEQRQEKSLREEFETKTSNFKRHQL